MKTNGCCCCCGCCGCCCCCCGCCCRCHSRTDAEMRSALEWPSLQDILFIGFISAANQSILSLNHLISSGMAADDSTRAYSIHRVLTKHPLLYPALGAGTRLECPHGIPSGVDICDCHFWGKLYMLVSLKNSLCIESIVFVLYIIEKI